MNNQLDFIEKIKENEGIIYKVSKIYTNNNEDQKDLYQEIVFQLWKSFKSFNENSKFSTWMYRVALNTSIVNFKRSKRSETINLNPELLKKIDQVDDVIEERIKILYRHIEQLTLIEKGIILVYLDGKSHDEISKITGFSVTNAGTRIARIKLKLKNNKSYGNE